MFNVSILNNQVVMTFRSKAIVRTSSHFEKPLFYLILSSYCIDSSNLLSISTSSNVLTFECRFTCFSYDIYQIHIFTSYLQHISLNQKQTIKHVGYNSYILILSPIFTYILVIMYLNQNSKEYPYSMYFDTYKVIIRIVIATISKNVKLKIQH